MLAVVFASDKFKSYIIGSKVTVYTDMQLFNTFFPRRMLSLI